MVVRQLSVFIENREGRMEQVTDILQGASIDIITLSLADTSEYGILRMIVSDPEKAYQTLRVEGLSARLTQVIAVRLPNEMGTLHHLLAGIRGINIEYMYVLSTGDNGAMVLKASDINQAATVLKERGFDLLCESDLIEA